MVFEPLISLGFCRLEIHVMSGAASVATTMTKTPAIIGITNIRTRLPSLNNQCHPNHGPLSTSAKVLNGLLFAIPCIQIGRWLHDVGAECCNLARSTKPSF